MFKKKERPAQQVLPTIPVDYPDGSVVITESGRWYIKNKYRFLVPSDRIFRSWNFPLVLNGTDASVSKYLKNGKIGFRSGSFVYNDGLYYIISGNLKRKIANPDVYAAFGLDPLLATWASDDELELHKNGEVFK